MMHKTFVVMSPKFLHLLIDRSIFKLSVFQCFTDFNAHKLRILFFPFLAQAGSVRDSMAKSLYSAMFDWIVFRTNHALLNNKDLEHSSKVGIKTYKNTSQNPVSVSLVLVLSKIMKMFLVFFLF